jgi:hypothetical protein
MQHQILWTAVNGVGLEHLRLEQTRPGAVAHGVIIRLEKRRPFRASYDIRCDAKWRARSVVLEVIAERPFGLRLVSDGAGRWQTPTGEPVDVFEGCVDLDVSPTPFTNTLAIRRLGLRPGEGAELPAAYVELPKLRLLRLPLRYTCIAMGPGGARYRYESLRSGFTRDLQVDAQGLVVEYPGVFRRIWPRRPSRLPQRLEGRVRREDTSPRSRVV